MAETRRQTFRSSDGTTGTTHRRVEMKYPLAEDRMDGAVAVMRELVDREPMSLAAFERYETLGLIPPGVLDRVRDR